MLDWLHEWSWAGLRARGSPGASGCRGAWGVRWGSAPQHTAAGAPRRRAPSSWVRWPPGARGASGRDAPAGVAHKTQEASCLLAHCGYLARGTNRCEGRFTACAIGNVLRPFTGLCRGLM
jgi:hypothetical protein